MVVYLDIIILENFIVNLFILFLTERTLKVRKGGISKIIASFVGSIYVIVTIYDSLSFFNLMPFKLVAALIINIIAFRQKDIVFNLKATGIYILYSMTLAGICIFEECSNTFDRFNFNISNFSYKKLMISMMVIYILSNRLVWYIKDRKEVSKYIYDVDIVVDEKCKRVKAFLDTGNELREPATNLPVVIVNKSIFKNTNLTYLDEFHIPYSVVNGKTGILYGFKPSYISIHGVQEKKEVIVALVDYKLSNINDYNALLSRGII